MDAKALINRLKTSGKTATKLIAEKTGDVNWTRVAHSAVAAGLIIMPERRRKRKRIYVRCGSASRDSLCGHPASIWAGKAASTRRKRWWAPPNPFTEKLAKWKGSRAPFLNVFTTTTAVHDAPGGLYDRTRNTIRKTTCWATSGFAQNNGGRLVRWLTNW